MKSSKGARGWLVALFLLFPAPILADAPVVLVLGDSLSAAFGMESGAGWVALLQERIIRQGLGYRVVNGSISGETTSGGRSRLPALLKDHHPRVVIIELGGNDGLRGLPLDSMRENLTAMVLASKEAGARVVLVGMRLPPNFGPAYTGAFASIYRQVANNSGSALVPFLLEGVAGNAALMQPDGVHATAGAQDELLDNVWPTLRPLLGDFMEKRPHGANR